MKVFLEWNKKDSEDTLDIETLYVGMKGENDIKYQ